MEVLLVEAGGDAAVAVRQVPPILRAAAAKTAREVAERTRVALAGLQVPVLPEECSSRDQ